MTDHVPTEALEAIIAGCEGVTPGPWSIVYAHDASSDVGIRAPGLKNIMAEVYSARNFEAEKSPETRPTAIHIARLSPEVVRAMATMAKEAAKLRLALAWLDHYDPEMVAAAEDKFGFKLTKDDAVKALTEGATHGR